MIVQVRIDINLVMVDVVKNCCCKYAVTLADQATPIRHCTLR